MTNTPPLAPRRTGRISAAIALRVVLATAAVCLAVVPVLAGGPALRAEVTAQRDVLALRDLVEGVEGAPADKPLFRAPSPGESGTIQTRRILEAAADLGFGPIDTGGRPQVVVTRAARRVGLAEIEAAVKRGLELHHGLDARPVSILFEGSPPALVAAPEVKAALAVEDLAYDRRTRRVTATVVLPLGGERRLHKRVSGAVVELTEVAVLARPVNRGDTVQASDLAIERRPRDGVPADAQPEPGALAGRVARRALPAGSVVRTGDLARPEIVAKGDLVTIVYETPGLVLTLRGRANEGGAHGDTVTVVNPQSKKTLQGTVVGPGKVSVGPASPGPVAVATVERPR